MGQLAAINLDITTNKINKMKINLIKTLAAIAATACFTTAVQATSVDGSITFAGGITLNNTSAGNATGVTAWTGADGNNSPTILTDAGDFATYAAPGTQVTFTASTWLFNSGALASFWTVGGFTFDLISSAITSQTGSSPHGQVAVSGTGTVSGNGFDSTVIVWNFSTQDPSSGHGDKLKIRYSHFRRLRFQFLRRFRMAARP